MARQDEPEDDDIGESLADIDTGDDDVDGGDDFAELKISRDIADAGLKHEEENQSEADRALKKIADSETRYTEDLDNFYRSIVGLPPRQDTPYRSLSNPNLFYKTLLAMGGESSVRLHRALELFLSDTDAQTQQVARHKTIVAFWNFYEEALEKNAVSLPEELIFMMRYGIVVTSLISRETLSIIANIDITAASKVGVFYVDEWLRAVSRGDVSQSVINEVSDKGATAASMKQKLTRLKEQDRQQLEKCAQADQEIKRLLTGIKMEIEHLENSRTITNHGFSVPYNSTDLLVFKDLHERLRTVVSKNSQLEVQYNSVLFNDRALEKLTQELQAMENLEKEKEQEAEDSDNELIERKKSGSLKGSVSLEELQIMRQMGKICVGARGNHFPILHSGYFSMPMRNMGYREQVLQIFRQIEMVDFTLFQRTIKGNITRIFPNVLLIPCYGNRGFCWEPFEKYQRNTTPAKLVVPMYPRDLYGAVIYALGDYRWQIAKETAGQFWMEEGLTGWYLQYFDSKKLKGQIKDKFVEDYALWMNWEQKGVQKLDKEAREIFWRFVPFNRKIKTNLAKMAPSYNDLYKKEKNRAMSDFA